MSVPAGDLRRQYLRHRKEIDEAIASVFESGHFILGENVRELERAFAAYLGCAESIGVGSGTDALRLALLAVDVQPGDEVITAANAGSPTAMAISSVGATPVFVEIEPDTYNVDPGLVEQKVSARTRVILPIHLYGHAVEMDPLMEIARRRGLYVIEDACQAHGATYRGRRVGGIGHLGCFSFYPTKNLGAYGDGGMVTTTDPALAEKVRLLREYGWKKRNHSVLLGVNSRLDEIQAAILRVKLPHLDTGNQRRRAIAALYGELLGGSSATLTLPVEKPYAEHIYHLYVVATPERDRLIQALRAKGIGAAVHYPEAAHLMPAYASLGLPAGSLPITERACASVLSLPMYPELTDEEVAEVASAVRAVL